MVEEEISIKFGAEVFHRVWEPESPIEGYVILVYTQAEQIPIKVGHRPTLTP
jgi:hypothetical protein